MTWLEIKMLDYPALHVCENVHRKPCRRCDRVTELITTECRPTLCPDPSLFGTLGRPRLATEEEIMAGVVWPERFLRPQRPL